MELIWLLIIYVYSEYNIYEFILGNVSCHVTGKVQWRGAGLEVISEWGKSFPHRTWWRAVIPGSLLMFDARM